MKTKVFTKITVLAVLAMAVATAAEKESVALARLGRRLEKEAAVRQRLEDQLKLLASAEEHCQERMAVKKQIESARKALEDEVLLLEAEASQQETRTTEAQDQADEVARTLKNHLDVGRRLARNAARDADKARRRLCETVTVDRGQLDLLCRGMPREPAPERPKVMRWLAKLRRSKGGDGTQPLLPEVLKLLLLLWAAWMAVLILLPPACKLRRPHSRPLKKD